LRRGRVMERGKNLYEKRFNLAVKGESDASIKVFDGHPGPS